VKINGLWEPEVTTPLFTVSYYDGCDKCGVQAFVKVTTNSGELRFCGHHYAENEEKIAELGYTTEDNRAKLLLRDFDIDVWTKDVKRSGK
jgi:hypothetical protein